MPKSNNKSFYAVANGRGPCPAIVRTWDECNEKVHRFPKALFKSFGTHREAEAWLGANYVETASTSNKPYDRPSPAHWSSLGTQHSEPPSHPVAKPKAVPEVQLSDEQEAVLQRVLARGNVFFSGSAGTGKSVLLRAIIQSLREQERNFAVTASTGIAALAVSGCTLHSWAGVGLGKQPVNSYTGRWLKNRQRYERVIQRWRTTEALLIDEISMIDGKFFDKLEEIARIMRHSDLPFGGIQLIICGDMFQLPPVPDRDPRNNQQIPSVFAFEAQTWDMCMGPPVNLTRVFRQKEQGFVDLLNAMRFGNVDEQAVAVFQTLQREVKYEDEIQPTEILSRRDEVEWANNRRLDMLTGETRRYTAQQFAGRNSEGQQITHEQMEKLLEKLVVPKQISLKVGAQVMLVKNLVQGTLVNGSLGIVRDFKTVAEAKEANILIVRPEGDDKKPEVPRSLEKERWPVVQFTNGIQMLAIPQEFTVENADAEMEAQRNQVPLILAWALSVHKAQGQTIERVRVDLKNTFEKGQAYVAISRATTLEGLQVLNFHRSKVMVCERVVEWQNRNEDLALRQRAREWDVIEIDD
uniref:ATP-dependent DNA helicase PIF1 n=1 Tax=Mycena chlorophos TaxID=658473 RepID=A0ABQ0KXJ8_MYCCL|nr:DNA repair and recombination protein [Mycena chlorophos]